VDGAAGEVILLVDGVGKWCSVIRLDNTTTLHYRRRSTRTHTHKYLVDGVGEAAVQELHHLNVHVGAARVHQRQRAVLRDSSES
jgi:hypothetical protein